MENFISLKISEHEYKIPIKDIVVPIPLSSYQMMITDMDYYIDYLDQDICLKILEKVDMNEHISFDAGGSGDCFIKAVNSLLKIYKHNKKLYTSSFWYGEFNLSVGTYLEEKQIMKIASAMNIVILVFRHYEGLLTCRGFGSYGTLILIYNDYPNHYYPIFKIDRKPLVLSEDDMISIKNEVNLKTQMVESSDEEESETESKDEKDEVVSENESSFSDQDVNKIFDDPLLNIREEVNFEDLYSYCQSRLMIKTSGKMLLPNDAVAYYKLRHNCFKTYSLFTLNLSNKEEKPLSDWGAPSNKTPDFFEDRIDFYLLIEFTVCNRFETAVEVKKGMKKYTQEMKFFSSIKPVYEFYLVLSLDKDISGLVEKFYQISNLLNSPLVTDPNEMMQQVHDEITFVNFHVSKILPELTYHYSEEIDSPLKKDDLFEKPFHMTKNILSMKRTKNQFIFQLLWKNLRKLENDFKFLPFRSKYLIFINVSKSTCWIEMSDKGLPKKLLLNKIQTNSLDLVNNLQIVGSFADVDQPFLRGPNIEFEMDLDRPKSYQEVFDDNNYLQRYINKLWTCDKKTLVDHKLKDQVDVLENVYEKLWIEKNKISDRVINQKKNTFIFPITFPVIGDFVSFGSNIQHSKLFITNMLIRNIKNIPISFKTISRNMNYDKLNEYSDLINKSRKKLHSLGATNRIIIELTKYLKNIKLQKKQSLRNPEIIREYAEDPLIVDEIMKLNELQRSYSVNINEVTRTSYKNRITMPKILYKKYWNDEVAHFGNNKGKIKTTGDLDFSMLSSNFQQLISLLFVLGVDESQDDVYSNTEIQGKKLAKTVAEMREVLDEKMIMLKHTNLMKNLLFISRLCYSLLYYSNIKLNKEDFCYDNLGYENVLLIVKGGKNIRTSKRSRLFKLVIPLIQGTEWLFESPHNEYTTNEKGNYVILPWQNWKFDYLKKGTELYYTFSNYYVCSLLESNLEDKEYTLFCSLKVLNMFSQRRKIEIWFSNLRYIYLNSNADYTNVLELVDSMVDYNYDKYFYFLQKSFMVNYKNIVSNCKRGLLYDILHNVVVKNFDLCAERFEETNFMTKAPVDPVNEHLHNLQETLSTQLYFEKIYNPKFSKPILNHDINILFDKTSIDISDEKYFDKLYSNDFMFDPKLCFLIGDYISKMLERNVSQANMVNKFSSLLSKSFTEIKTSKGMRSKEKEFWGKKGHDVVFDELNYSKLIIDTLNDFPTSFGGYEKLVSESHISYFEKIKSLSDIMMEFDIKDKLQYKGSREIYVMTDVTKVLQQPLEQFFKYLCSMMPNELINKKSHIRPKFIHSKVFEQAEEEHGEKTFCTLDCRKWAPRSNILKYYYFIMGMKILPESFKNYFNAVWYFMLKKKVRIQSKYFDLLDKNPLNKEILSVLTKRDDGDYEFENSLSFMMGIFNYLSSLFHSATQLFFNEKISLPNNVTFNLIAHSDDSGGVITSKSKDKNAKYFRLYEIFQKTCNHLMSIKKSALSSTTFEIISIMYHKSKLIPITHKFLANVSFEPKGLGWASDISTIVSKMTELFSNGGTYLQMYSTMLTMDEMIRKFYHLPRTPELSGVPISFGGVFNMHPIHLILLGTDAQEIMLDLVEGNNLRNFRIDCHVLLCGNYIPGRSSGVKSLIPYHKRHENTLVLTEEQKDLLNNWSLIGQNRSLEDAVDYYSSLYNTNFTYSLTGVDTMQLYLATLFGKVKLYRMEEKIVDMRKFCIGYIAFKKINLKVKEYDYVYSNFYEYMKMSEGIYFKLSTFDRYMDKTCKPFNYETFTNIGLNLDFNTLNQLIAYYKDDKIKQVLANPDKFEVLKDWLTKSLNMDENLTMDTLASLERKDIVKSRSAYLFLPSRINIDTIERFWTYTIMYTTRRYYITSLKPQFYTLNTVLNWDLDYDLWKHLSLLIKVFMNIDFVDKLDLDQLSICRSCKQNKMFRDYLNQIVKLRNLDFFKTTNTWISFAIYEKKQFKGTNVWFGPAEFTLYTIFGSVKHFYKEGNAYTEWSILDETVMSNLYHAYKIFCESRGIRIESPTYTYNYDSYPKLGFNNMNGAILLSSGMSGIALNYSSVKYTDVCSYKVYKNNKGEILYSGSKCDFELYFNYDLNETFYKEHQLKQIKDFVFPDEKVVKKEEILNNFLGSKILKVLKCDESHESRSHFNVKYENNGLLGSLCSFSRALCLADDKGITRYRSSANPDIFDLSVFEGKSVMSIPIMDLIASSKFSRLNFKDYRSLIKLCEGLELKYEDLENLKGLKEKMGLIDYSATLISFSLKARDFKPLEINKMDPNELLKMIMVVISAIQDSMSPLPENKRKKYQFKGKKQDWWNKMYLLFEYSDVESIVTHLISGIFRSQYDNSGQFWRSRSENRLASLLLLNEKTINNLFNFLRYILNSLKSKKLFPALSNDLANFKEIVLAKRKYKDLDMEDFDDQFTYDEELKFGEIIKSKTWNIFSADPDAIEDYEDCDNSEVDGFNRKWNFKKNSDVDDSSEEEEEDDEDDEDDDSDEIDEEFLLEDKEYFIITNKHRLILQEETLTYNYNSLKINFIGVVDYHPWLGGYDKSTVNIDGVFYTQLSYPGKSFYPENLSLIPRFTLEEQKTTLEILDMFFKQRDIDKIKKEEIEKEALEKEKGQEEMKNDYRSYLVKELTRIKIPNPEQFLNIAFGEVKLDLHDYLEKYIPTISDLFNNQSTASNLDKRLKNIKNYLPGFIGVINDSELKSEVSAIFGENADLIFGCNMRINKFMLQHFQLIIKSYFNKVSDTKKAMLSFLLSTMKDAIVCDNSDSWYVDTLAKYILEIEEEFKDKDDSEVYILPDTQRIDIVYETKDEYSDSDDEEY